VSRTSTASSSRRRTAAAEPPAVPHTAEEVRAALARLSVHPSRGLGQSFLIDPFVADAEAALVEPAPGRRVLEVGGGLGILTEALVRRGVGPLTVVEKDVRLARRLRRVFAPEVRVVEGDALEIHLTEFDVVVGNLPYSVATPLLLNCFRARVPRVVFLVQDEVARRLAAQPGSKEFGRLTLFTRLHGEVELFRAVPPAAFEPAPAVVSRLGVHVARSGELPVHSVERFEEVVRVLFSSRRKQLGNLVPRLGVGPTELDQIVRAASWPADWRHLRPEALEPTAYFALAEALEARATRP
jgi:16S rRNA (adenine1518-N6/adenine1519-N6)-dimethyltransferase